jgi:ribosomal protein S18 acetylase RimI-like enzyme
VTPNIRPYTPADLTAVLGLVIEMQDHERAIDARLLEGAEMTVAYTEAMLQSCAAHAGRILVAESHGVVVGFVAVLAEVPETDLDQPPGSYALISDLAVTAARRGAGIGRALLAAAEQYARHGGASELRIAVLTGNDPAERLYRSAGFRPWLQVLTKAL